MAGCCGEVLPNVPAITKSDRAARPCIARNNAIDTQPLRADGAGSRPAERAAATTIGLSG